MSKKHFERIAGIMAEQRSRGNDAERWRCDEISRALADYFAEENSRFDRARFLKACDEAKEHYEEVIRKLS